MRRSGFSKRKLRNERARNGRAVYRDACHARAGANQAACQARAKNQGGTGAERGLALVFMVTGVVGVLTTLLALRSRSYRRLSRSFAGSQDDGDAGEPGIVEKAVDGVA